MTATEVNYAQIEKEMLAILFEVERFEQCVYGRPVKIETDHKPLESIFRKSLATQCPQTSPAHVAEITEVSPPSILQERHRNILGGYPK